MEKKQSRKIKQNVKTKQIRSFEIPPELKLGVATAATQIEGGDKNNSWYAFSMKKGNVKDGTNSLRANDHYEHFREDTALMEQMNVEVYRFSLEWSRIEPEEGKFDEAAIAHYSEEICELKKHGIKPLVTLHHFSNPLWFEKRGGFERADSVRYFSEYTCYVAEHLGKIADEFCPINEPNIYAVNGYLFGVWPPAKKNFAETIAVLRNMAKCHIEAYKILHEMIPGCRVGFANHLIAFDPRKKESAINRTEAAFFMRGFQWAVMDAMAFGKFDFPLGCAGKRQGIFYDFIGINYYTRNVVFNLHYETDSNVFVNDLGWEIYPKGIRRLCRECYKRYGKDIFITENGTCDSRDAFRAKYIYAHLYMISDLPFVKRYYHWTFMDNFEWAEGESARFGLVAYNYDTGEKTIRKSGSFYSEIMKQHCVTDEMIQKYLV